ncbi:unnamed protein product [Acanthoscelides obtectus]|uniref:Uncharacterized protein n=1 Tax=Acanthoscelides obtectus TaxID=200917 RepID=A0A9P0KVV6_ACAOB|nr:unnamed protein product [Acanthoscelides obtectus]CAK1651157.1 hypothetical protein AOBTE_LOCUS17098 [Acanthoscelides obtectus]
MLILNNNSIRLPFHQSHILILS